MLNNYFAKKEPSIEGLVRWIADLGGKAPAIKKLPAHPAAFGSFGALDPRIVNALKKRGVEALYSHQSAAVECALSGIDCVIATPTASGKTLCYNLPVMHAVLQDASARPLSLPDKGPRAGPARGAWRARRLRRRQDTRFCL